MRILFIQLPNIDNDTCGDQENVRLAAGYLSFNLNISGSLGHDCICLHHESDSLGNRAIVDRIVEIAPDAVVCTLYLWNIERTLHILKEIKKRIPDLKTLAGGPEVSEDHPFLYRNRFIDVACVGEGETVFPEIISALVKGRQTDYVNVAWRTGNYFKWGKRKAPQVLLQKNTPGAGSKYLMPDSNGVGYLETTRGCPMRCTFCRYHHMRSRVNLLPTAEVLSRAEHLIEYGAREIRFIDPTFNSNPQWRNIVIGLGCLSKKHSVKFFAEIKGDHLTADDVALLSNADFSEIEIGLQSSDPAVQKNIRRSTRMSDLKKSLSLLQNHNIKVTLDVMYGLPGQTTEDVYESIAFGRSFSNIQVQCMQTLMLPGTEIRCDAKRFGITSHAKPPYGVLRSSTMTRSDISEIEQMLAASSNLPADPSTAGFIGYRLRGLFSERHKVNMNEEHLAPVKSIGTRITLFIEGSDLYADCSRIKNLIRKCVTADTDAHWQFVVCPEYEEPLDFFEDVIKAMKELEKILADRSGSAWFSGKLVARRLRVKMNANRMYDKEWIREVDDELSNAFY